MTTVAKQRDQGVQADPAVSPSDDIGPKAWGLLGAREGDNRQVQYMLDALEFPFDLKPLAFNRAYVIPNRVLGATSVTLRPESRAALEPPWPDLVIAAGRRTVPVARWIKRQSGGRTKLVQIGRPRAPLAWFDLVVTTHQYGLPQAANVAHNLLPIQTAPKPDGAARDRWQQTFSELPKPWVGLLVGGEVWPFRLDADIAAEIGAQASAAAQARGGSLIAVTSPRTGRAATEALFSTVRGPSHLCDWRAVDSDCYASLLELADRFIVTADSVSMLSEACRTGKPVEVLDLPKCGDPVTRSAAAMNRIRRESSVCGRIVDTLIERGLFTPPRDTSFLAERLVTAGLAAPFGGQIESASHAEDSLSKETDRTLARMRELLGR